MMAVASIEDDHSSFGENEDAEHLAQLATLIFLPGLKAWALSTMGFTTRQIFTAWRKFVFHYGGVQQRIGADVQAEIGQYVLPTKDCAPKIDEDAGGMAGRIIRIIRADGAVESENQKSNEIGKIREAQADLDRANENETACTGRDEREVVFVLWAIDGIMRGGYELPNRWELLMAGKNLQSGEGSESVQPFPLCLASEEMIQEAKEETVSREFKEDLASLPVPQPKRSSRAIRKRNADQVEKKEVEKEMKLLAVAEATRIQTRQQNKQKKTFLKMGGFDGMTLSSALKHTSVGIFDALNPPIEKLKPQQSSSVWSEDSLTKSNLFRGDPHPPESPLRKTDLYTLEESVVTPTFAQGSPSRTLSGRATASSSYETMSTAPGKGIPYTGSSHSIASLTIGSSMGMYSPIGTMGRTGSSTSQFTFDVNRASDTKIDESVSKDSSSHSPQVTVFDFIKPKLLNSDFMVRQIAQLPIKRQVMHKDVLPRPIIVKKNSKSEWCDVSKFGRLRMISKQAKERIRMNKVLEKVAHDQKSRGFQCRVMEEKELKYLPQVVAANPGRPHSILIVSPMHEAMSTHAVKSLVSELEQVQTSTLCVRDMIEPWDVKEFCETVKTWLPMTSLNALRMGLAKPPRALTTLCLSRVNLGLNCVSYFITGILRNPHCRLRHLYCLSNNLGDEGTIQIAQCLSQLDEAGQRCSIAATLVSLWLEQNEIQDKGASALAFAVAHHPCLEHLDLRGNNITDKGAEAMVVVVKTNGILKQLNLNDNWVIGFGNTAFDRASRKSDAVAANLTVMSGTQARMRLACRPRSAKPNCSSSLVAHTRCNFQSHKNASWQSGNSGLRSHPKEMDRKMLSKRETAWEEHDLKDRHKTVAREKARAVNISTCMIEHARKSQEDQNARRHILEIEKNLAKLHAKSANFEEEKKDGWKMNKERVEKEIEWFTRDLARRQKLVQEAGDEMRIDVLHLLYQQHLIMKQEHFIIPRIKPTPEFLEDMECIYGTNRAQAEEDSNTEAFPPVGTKEKFLFDPNQIQKGLLISPQNAETVANSILTFVSKGDCDWSSALLEPRLSAQPCFVDFVILDQPDNIKKCNLLFGISKEPYAVSNVEESPPFLEKSGIMLFPRHGRVYHGGSVVHSLASPVILEKGDRFSMMINSEHTLLTFYHARHGFRHEVGQVNLTSLKGWDHTAYSAKKLRWAVTLGNEGQSIEAHNGRIAVQRERSLEGAAHRSTVTVI